MLFSYIFFFLEIIDTKYTIKNILFIFFFKNIFLKKNNYLFKILIFIYLLFNMFPFNYIPETIDPKLRKILIILITIQFIR